MQTGVVNIGAVQKERDQRVFDRLEVLRRQRELVLLHQPGAHELQGVVAQLEIGGLLRESREQLLCRRPGAEPFRAPPREQPRDEVRAIAGALEQRLVEQVQPPVPGPDVDDERHRGPEPGDEAEVLLGADADVDAAHRPERLHRVDVLRFVGNEVVRVRKVAGRL